MGNASLLLLLVFCIFIFQQTSALHRIKRGSTGSENKTKLSVGIQSDQYNSSGAITAPAGDQEVQSHTGHAWAKKAVAAVGNVIDKAFASLTHKSPEEKPKKSTQPSHASPSHTNIQTTKSEDNNVVGKILHHPSHSYLRNNGGFGERFLDDMQHEGPFEAGEGAAEFLIIDNGLQPMLGMQHGLSPFAFHQPNLRSIANSFKRLSEISKESKSNNLNTLKVNADHSNNKAGIFSIGKLSNDKGISEGNANKEDAMLQNNGRNDNHNSGSKSEDDAADSRKRNNDHVTTSNGNNGDQSHHTISLQQLQQPEVKDALPTLLSHSQKSLDGIEESKKMRKELEGEQQRMKHDSEKTEEMGERGTNEQAGLRQQQQMHVFKHSNGNTFPMESFLKFANMMLYKVGPDGTPIHAQGAQLSVNGNPKTSVISISPALEGAENAEAIDFLYNSLDPKLNLLRNLGSPGAAPNFVSPSSATLLSRPFALPPYSLAGPAQPINVIENALDLLLSPEDEGNDEVELICPIHHPKKKSNEKTEDGQDKNEVIQVCSCRFFKKNKNA